jgi:membrane-associated phospholipid phosphatase
VTRSGPDRWRTPRQASLRLVAAGAVLLTVYESLGTIIAATGQPPRDRWILAAERWLFRGALPPLAPLHLAPWVVDAFSIVYVVYFALPAMLLTVLVRRGWLDEARAAMRIILVAYYMHYAIYLLVPAVGPIRASDVAPEVRAQLASAGGAVTHRVRRGIDALERTRQDAFPSAHTSIAIIVAVLARRYRVRGRALFAIVAAAIMCGTVVLGYHYIVDVIAAVPISLVALRSAAPKLDPRLAPHLKSPPWRSSITSTSA